MATIAIDFDGTLHPYRLGWQGTDVVADEDPDPLLWAALEALRARGHRLVIFSARAVTPEGTDAIRRWLVAQRIEHHFDAITAQKPPAAVYIDDRAHRFDPEIGWADTARAVLELVG